MLSQNIKKKIRINRSEKTKPVTLCKVYPPSPACLTHYLMQNMLRVADRKLALKGAPICLAVTAEREESVSVAVARRIQQERREWRERVRREEESRGDARGEKSESRPIRAPRQGDLCLIRRSRLAEAVRTGIHIRYGLGSGFSPRPCLPDADTTAAAASPTAPTLATPRPSLVTLRALDLWTLNTWLYLALSNQCFNDNSR